MKSKINCAVEIKNRSVVSLKSSLSFFILAASTMWTLSATALELPREYAELLERAGYKRQDAVIRTHGSAAGNNCDPIYKGGPLGGKLWKTRVMGDGNIGNGYEDGRRHLNASDLISKSVGSIWCENLNGNLIQSGSATAVDSVVEYDPDKRAFVKRLLPKPANGQMRIVATGHNYHIGYEDGGLTRFSEVSTSCYFYPHGNEPRDVILPRTGGGEIFYKAKFRANESSLRARIDYKNRISPFGKEMTNRDSLDTEWSVAVIDGNISVEGASVISLTDQNIDRLQQGRSADIKQYGYSNNFKSLAVAEDDKRLFTRRPGQLNQNFEHILLDCNDTNGGASGGPATIGMTIEGGEKIEAVFGVRVGNINPSGPAPLHGDVCDPFRNANVLRAIRSDFYESLRR